MKNYRLVPLEPTPDMLFAARSALIAWATRSTLDKERAVYKAMLAAAPVVEQEPVAWLVKERTYCGDATTDKDAVEYLERCAPGCTTPLYLHPQPAQDAAGTRCARCDQGTEPKMCGDFAIHPTSYDGCPHPQDICNRCGHSRECHARRTAPDVAAYRKQESES